MTAVNWLLQELEKVNYHSTEAMIMYAKKLEKQQIIDAYKKGFSEGVCFGAASEYKYITSEQYYNETYRSNKEEQKKLITEIMNEDAKDGLYGSKGSDDHIVDTNEMVEISDEEIEAQALTFAKEESYGELNTDLWKGYVFGAKRIREQLKSRQ